MESESKSLPMKKLFMMLVFMLVLLSACERPATRSLWTPLDAAGIQSTPTLSPSIPPIKPSASTGVTQAAIVTPTPVSIATLDLGSISGKYPLAFKGYELLTWQKDGEWVFTLLTGTNRQKSFDEILAAENNYSATELYKVTVVGVEDFKKLLTHLPSGEQITWGGMDLAGEVPAGTIYFSYPPDGLMNDLIKYCKLQGITLISLKKE